jgi:hypothetical protein
VISKEGGKSQQQQRSNFQARQCASAEEGIFTENYSSYVFVQNGLLSMWGFFSIVSSLIRVSNIIFS